MAAIIAIRIVSNTQIDVLLKYAGIAINNYKRKRLIKNDKKVDTIITIKHNLIRYTIKVALAQFALL